MKQWEYKPEGDHFEFDFLGSFDEQIAKLKSNSGGNFKRGGDNYYVLWALFLGHTIDDYVHRVKKPNGKYVHNIRSRVSDLRENWNICIGSRSVESARNKEYQICGRGV